MNILKYTIFLSVTRRFQASGLKEFKVVCGGVSQPLRGFVLVTCEDSRQQKHYLVIAGPTYIHVHTAETYLNKSIFTQLTCEFSFIRLTHINLKINEITCRKDVFLFIYDLIKANVHICFEINLLLKYVKFTTHVIVQLK